MSPTTILLLSWMFARPGAELETGAGYELALASLREATVATNIDPQVGAEALAEALVEILDYAPLLAADPGGRELQVMGELALARAALTRGEQSEANEIVDRLLTILIVADELERLDRDKLGPSLDALLASRAAHSPYERLARLAVRCAADCDIYIDGREVDMELAAGAGIPLTIGRHALWIESDGAPTLRQQIAVESLDTRFDVGFPAVDAPPPRVAELDIVPVSFGPARAARPVAPRGVELTLVSVGLAGVGAGVALWLLDDSCSGPGPRTGVGACANLYDTRSAGISTLTVSASALITGSIMLAIDERRRRNQGARK